MNDHKQKCYIVNIQILVYFNSTTLTFIKKVLKLKYEARI